MMKGNGSKTLRAVLAAALGMVMLVSLAWAGVSEVTGGSTSTTYKHTYHTNVKGTATIKFVDDKGVQTRVLTETHESGYVVGGVGDEAVQAEIGQFNKQVNALIGSQNATKVNGNKETVFDRFESAKVEENGVEILDVHEYQVYTITEEWVVARSGVTVNTTVKNVYTDTNEYKTFDLTKGENTFADAGRYFGAGGTMTVQFSGLSTPVEVVYTVTGDTVTMTVSGYDTLPDGVYSSEYREHEDKMTTKHEKSVLESTSMEKDESGNWVFNEVRTDYHTRNHVFVNFTLTVGSGSVTPSGGSSYSGPYITALLTASDAKSATDYSGGIYGLTFKSSASFPSFLGVQVDGKAIDKSCYIAEEGSIEVYLKAVYLRTLAAGKHTVTILSSQGNTTAEFTIGGLNTAPKTFDAGMAVYGVTAMLSLGGMAWMGKKKVH